MMIVPALISAFALSGVSLAASLEDVRTRLEADFHQSLYSRTYQSLLDRVESDGYFEESLTGAYAGMFPRTVGGLVSLFLETGELDRSQRLIDFVLRAMQVNEMERVAHVIGREQTVRDPVVREGQTAQPEHPTALYRLDQPERFGGAQEFTAPDRPLTAVELFISGDRCDGMLTLQIAQSLDGPTLNAAQVSGASLKAAGDWVRFEFPQPPALEPGKGYVLRVHFVGEGVPVWWGLESVCPPLGGGHGRDTQMTPGWMNPQGHAAAFALDTGALEHAARTTIPILCRRDQIDGQAHVILAWARLALRRGQTDFEERTWPQVALLMDRSSDYPYLSPYQPGVPIVQCETGLVRNVCFEHSRDGRFWDTFDLLTQSFVAAALTDMVRVAERRRDSQRAGRWRQRLASLERAIAGNLTRELEGRRVYLEMRLPDGGGGRPFEGLGWVNLSPVAAGWEGVDRDILRNTVAAYRERAMFDWEGKPVLALDWWPDRPLGKAVIGKGVGWEMVYSLDEGEFDRICQWLDFVEAVNTAPLYMEACSLGGDGKWHPGDPGNGEQCAWWCWGMARLRKAVGLSAGA